jgi:uncharacterized Zn finger protein (UPF0148 family)
MSDPSLKSEFPCSKCGGKLEFKPGTDHIVCVYCGHDQPVVSTDDNFVVQEYDLQEALKNTPKLSPAQLASNGKEIRCDSCGAVSVITEQSDRCVFCASPVVVEVAKTDGMIAPESLLPFKIDKKTAGMKFKEWISGLWFAPSDLSKRANQSGMDGVYLPYWTYDAHTTTKYVGQRGVYYYETETYKDANGETQTREVRKTRWYPASGTVKVFFDDVLVCASKSLPHSLIDGLEPWDLEDLKKYEPSYLSGFVTERYKIDLKDGYEIAKQKMEDPIRAAVCEDIGGDTQQISSIHVSYFDTKFKHLLLPLWISCFKYSGKVYRFAINARTGDVSGERPWSWVKIFFASMASAGVLGLAYYFMEQAQ